MSEPNDPSDTPRDPRAPTSGVDAALDAELSAYLDDALPPERRAALEALCTRQPAIAARLARLRAVDEGLRALASGAEADRASSPEAEARLDTLHAELQTRLAEAGAAGGAAPLRQATRGPGRIVPMLLAAAAAIALYLVLPGERPDESPGVEGERSSHAGQSLSVEELEIIDRLEVLEYLAARESGENG